MDDVLTDQNKRAADRQRLFAAGKITAPSSTAPIKCLVRDLSSTGAKLTLETSGHLPEEFDFEVPLKHINVRAKVAWRSGDQVGITFVTSETLGGDAALKKRIRELETEVTRLRMRISELTGGSGI